MASAGVFAIPHLRPMGRFQEDRARREGALPLFWAGSGLELAFTGSSLTLLLEADFETLEPWIAAELNGAPLIRAPLRRGINEITVFRGMSEGPVKRVRLTKETQPMTGDPRHRLWVRGLRWEGGAFLPLPARRLRLEFVGDSLTSGEGVVGAREETDWVSALFSAGGSWSRMAADMLDADGRFISQSGWGVLSGWDNDPRHALPDWYEAVCAPALGTADRAMGAQLPNDFAAWRPDAVVVNLGTNDASAMGSPPWAGPDGGTFQQSASPAGLAAFEEAALGFLRRLRRCNPDSALIWAYGMLGDPLRPQLERAVDRFQRETGTRARYLPLPAATPETMGSRRHPGPACHRAAAEAARACLCALRLP